MKLGQSKTALIKSNMKPFLLSIFQKKPKIGVEYVHTIRGLPVKKCFLCLLRNSLLQHLPNFCQIVNFEIKNLKIFYWFAIGSI